MGWGALFNVVDRITGWLPVQSKVERWRNKLAKAKEERAKLLQGDADEKKTVQLLRVDATINELERLLANRD